MKKYPFVDWGELQENFWPLVKYSITRGIAKAGQNALPAASRNTVLKKIVGGLFDGMYTFGDQQVKTRWQQSCPKIAAWQMFGRTPAEIKCLYTTEVTKNGVTYEIPVYVQSPDDPDPTDDIFQSNLDHVRDNEESPYNQEGKMRSFYREDFSLIGAEKFTREDFNRLQDPESFRRWFTMDECWNIQQFGEHVATETKTDTHGNTYTIRKYKRESDPMKWLYWTAGDIIYDFVDAPFDPLQRYVESIGLPPDSQQTLIKEEYKMIAGIRRSVFRNTSRNPMDFDLTDNV